MGFYLLLSELFTIGLKSCFSNYFLTSNHFTVMLPLNMPLSIWESNGNLVIKFRKRSSKSENVREVLTFQIFPYKAKRDVFSFPRSEGNWVSIQLEKCYIMVRWERQSKQCKCMWLWLEIDKGFGFDADRSPFQIHSKDWFHKARWLCSLHISDFKFGTWQKHTFSLHWCNYLQFTEAITFPHKS